MVLLSVYGALEFMQVCVQKNMVIILIACLHLSYFQKSLKESTTLFIYI